MTTATQDHDTATDVAAAEQPPPQVAQAVDTEERGLTRTGAMAFGLVPRNFDEGWRMATVFAKSQLVPKNYQNRPEDIIIAMQYGAEIGLPPMASLQSVAVINGKPGVYGDGFLAVIMSKPAYARHVEYYELASGEKVKSLRQADYASDETKAVAMFWRKGNPEPFVAEFSIGDAKRAKLWGKEGPWSTYPARQMKWRARGFAGRDGFAAELRGVKMAEELLDTPEDEPGTGGEEWSPITEPVRRSEKPVGSGATTAAAPEPATPEPQPAAAQTLPAAEASKAPTPKKVPAAKAEPPKASAFANLSPTVMTPGMRITHTEVVDARGAGRYYQIRAEKPDGKDATVFTLVTDNEQLYAQAASCEGSDTLFDVAWAGGKKHDKTPCKVLQGLAASH